MTRAFRCAAVVLAGAAAISVAPPGVSAAEGFEPSSTGWVGPERGFVLGYARCGGGWCSQLKATDDGGAHWRSLQAPPVPYPDNHNRVRIVAADDQHLYVTDGMQIRATRDQGAHWYPVGLAGAAAKRYVAKVVEFGGRSFALVTGDGGAANVYAGAAGAQVLTPVPGLRIEGGNTGGDLSVRGGLQIVLDADHRTERYWTSHDGIRFTTAPSPCPAGETASLGGVQDGQVTALCNSGPAVPQPGHMMRELWRARGFGGIFSGTAAAPNTGITLSFGAATAESATVAAEGGAAEFLHHTTDGGRTWTTTVLSEHGYGVADLAFPDNRMGVLVEGQPDAESGARLYRTTDGGCTWQPLAVG
ncbi:sialidase family protein [Amycolatopsis sulphurea]|uniref:sialidase family protein n=1 Tax=Amycolatopsis sulphurea TaxID=76022 RepID=UPI000BF84765|nr:hypothetical protein [Amycolatopsis sulphurea]